LKGGYGHSAAYDFLTEKVYVYGGIVSESESSQVLSSRLYAYEPATRIWSLLSAAPSARLLITFDEELNQLQVPVRVGIAIDVVGQAGKPKTITGQRAG